MAVPEITVQSIRLLSFCAPEAEDELLKSWENADLSWMFLLKQELSAALQPSGVLTEWTKRGNDKLSSTLQKAVRKGTKINLETS